MVRFWKKKATPGGICAAVASHVGRVRPNNEDNFLLGDLWNARGENCCEGVFTGEGWFVAAVFDGMGGGEAGELASRAAAECLRAAVPGIDSRAAADDRIRWAFQAANDRVVELQSQYQILGTTGTVLCTDGVDFQIYHVGDSRAYLFRGGRLCRLTRDQTLAQLKLEMGAYGPDASEADQDRHRLTEYIGRDKTCTHLHPQESGWLPLEDSGILLCSDGLYDECTDADLLLAWQRGQTAQAKANAFIQAALDRGGKDNITAIVCQPHLR